jgi:hypothetical protein
MKKWTKLMVGDDGEHVLRILPMGYELYYKPLLSYKHHALDFYLRITSTDELI